MAYVRNDLISRAGYSGVGGTLQSFGTVLRGIGQGLQPQPSNADIAAALYAQQQQGSGMETVLLIGGLGLVAYLFLKKKKPKPAATGGGAP